MSNVRPDPIRAGIAFLLLMFCSPLFALDKVALVIGNSAYEHTSRLANPINDADAISKKLDAMGYSVKQINDADLNTTLNAVEAFSLKANGADAAVVYFAGHGIEVNGENYLVPIDAKLATETRVRYEAISLSDVMGSVKGAKNLQLVMLDSCRNNPLANDMKRHNGSRSAFRGLTRPRSLENTLVVYATKAGTVAKDGTGANSPFAEALLKYMDTPDLDIRLMIGKVRDYVKRHYDQTPFLYGTLGGDSVYLGRKSDTPSIGIELAFWSASGCSERNRNGCSAYLARYPNGQFASLASIFLNPKNSQVPGTVFKDCDDCPEMVVLPKGSFLMGSPSNEAKRTSDKGPQHRVTIGYSLAVGKYEVTFNEWQACVNAGACKAASDSGWGKDRRPVINVSWHNAKAYVAWLSKKTGKGYRLLSEAEWEYAARAGSTSPFYTGQCINTRQANYDGNNDYNNCGAKTGVYLRKTQPVGRYSANNFGLYDMAGNVLEWVEDCYHNSYVGAPSNGGAKVSGCSSADMRVLRGGSWADYPRFLRSADRFWYAATDAGGYTGFRVARTP